MQKTLATCSLFFVALCGAAAARADTCSTTAGNLITNCGFETGTFRGWSGTSTTDSNSGVDNLDPYQGTYGAFLGAFNTPPLPTTLSQTFATVAGQQYTIQFALDDTYASGSTSYPNSFAADFGSSVLFSETDAPLSSYVLHSFTATATGSSTTLSFLTMNDLGYFDLDDVSVVRAAATTPEPSSLLLMGTGLLGTVGLLRRRLNA